MKKTFVLGLAILLFAGGVMTACTSDKLEGQARNVFPSVLEEFALEDFTADFFENNTLILVPFEWSSLLGKYLDFYTVFVENGKLNFLIEVTFPGGISEDAIDSRVFAVIIPNQVFSKYEIGESIVFETYEIRWNANTGNFRGIKNCRKWLSEVEKNSIKHSVGYAWAPLLDTGWPFRDHPRWLLGSKITVISSVESLQEYFIAGAAE